MIKPADPLPASPGPQQTDEIFRLLVEGVKDYAIFMLDPQGSIVTWNPGAERIKGYKAAEVIGRHFKLFYTPEDVAAGRPENELEVAKRVGRYEEEGLRVRKDGTRFFAHVLVTALYDHSGALRGFAKVTRDITERKRNEDELKRSQEELRALSRDLERRVEERTQQLSDVNAELESFCYSVSHDLRAPLRGMQGFAQALQEDYGSDLDGTANDYLRRITRASQRMETLIQDLLDYSRISREHISFQAVGLERIVDEALAQIAGETAVHSPSIEVERPMPWVRADHSVLVRVAANLISNATKFVEPEKAPQVRVYAEPREECVRLWVEDNGIGIKPEHRERIFRVFERLHGVEKFPGTGIGLAIVRKGMERMQGSAGVESQLGHGSRFWIELPRGEAP